MPLSSKQMEYLALTWQCFESEPKIDYEKFKNLAGLASAASARELLRVTKKKLREEYGALGGAGDNSNTVTAPATPSSTRKSTKSVATPGSSTRKRGRPSKNVVQAAPDRADDDDDDIRTDNYTTQSPTKDASSLNGSPSKKPKLAPAPAPAAVPRPAFTPVTMPTDDDHDDDDDEASLPPFARIKNEVDEEFTMFGY